MLGGGVDTQERRPAIPSVEGDDPQSYGASAPLTSVTQESQEDFLRQPWPSTAESGGTYVQSGGHVRPGAMGVKRKPPTYDDKTNWKEYQVQFEMLAEACRWNNRQKAIELASSLRD